MVYAIYAVIFVIIFLLGAVLGSFLNVLVYRLPRRISFVRGFSFCPKCAHRLYPLDLVPVFSWVFLGGKCRYCREPISPRYPIVEAVCGAAAVVLYAAFPWPKAVLFFGTFFILLMASLVDADIMEIPDSTHVVLVLLAGFSFYAWPEISWQSHLIGCVCVSVPFFIITLIKEGAFGFGDVKLMAAAGLLLGWQHTLLATFIGIITGGIFATGLLISKRKGAKGHFAFGPFLSLGIFTSMIFGDVIIDRYLCFGGL
jgi:leader peptidase (prepilin peptidase)/N-methyltransferase